MVDGFSNLVGGMYPPDNLVNLAKRLLDNHAWDRTWEYKTGVDVRMPTWKVICNCPQSRSDLIMPVSTLPPGITMKNPVVTMERHFHIDQLVFFVGKCGFCNTFYWSSPSLKEDKK